MTLDRFRPGTGQQVADVLQLPELLDEPGSSASPAMVRLAVRQASEALAASDWRSLWNRERTAVARRGPGRRPARPGRVRRRSPPTRPG